MAVGYFRLDHVGWPQCDVAVVEAVDESGSRAWAQQSPIVEANTFGSVYA